MWRSLERRVALWCAFASTNSRFYESSLQHSQTYLLCNYSQAGFVVFSMKSRRRHFTRQAEHTSLLPAEFLVVLYSTVKDDPLESRWLSDAPGADELQRCLDVVKMTRFSTSERSMLVVR